MQRSAGKNATSEPSTPNGPPSKRVRLSNGTSAPGTPATPSVIVPQSAEGKRREEALARAAERSGETKWVLSFQDPRHANRAPAMQVRQAGFAVIDAEDDSEDEEEQKPVRMQFGGGVKKKQAVGWESFSWNVSKCTDQNQKTVTPAQKEDWSESESDSSDDFSSDDPTAALIRETKHEVAAKERDARKAKKSKAETPKRYNARVDEDTLLGGLSSLSGGGRAGGSGARNNSDVECFQCGQKGHFRGECPNAPRGFAGRGRGGGRGHGRR
jgi:hypothetical protein